MSVEKITVQNQLRKGTGTQERDFSKLQYPLLIGDQNGNEVSCNTGSPPDSFQSVSCLSYGNSPDVEMSECNSSLDHDGKAFNYSFVFLNESVGDPILEENLDICGRSELVSLPQVKEQFKGIVQSNLPEADPNLETWNPNITLEVPCMQDCTKNRYSVDIGTKKMDLEYVTPGNEIAIDAGGRLPDPAVTENSLVPKNRSAGNTHASLDSLSYDEMVMRSNSFMLSSSGKPPSASILEPPDSTSSIPSGQGRFSSTMPGICGGTFEKIQPEISSCNFVAKQCTVEVPKELPEDDLQVDCNVSQENSHYEMQEGAGHCLPNCLHPAQRGSFSDAATVCEMECVSHADHCVKDPGNIEISDQEGAMLINIHKVGVSAVDPSTQDLIPMSKAEADVLIPQLRLVLSPNEGEAARAANEIFLVHSPENCNYHTHMSTPLPESKNEIPEQATENVKDLFSCNGKNSFQTFKCNQWPCELKIQNSTRPTTSTTSKPAKVEILKYPKPDFKNIKPKVVSRPLVKTDNPSHIRNLLRSPSMPSHDCPLPRASQSQEKLQKEKGPEKGHEVAHFKATKPSSVASRNQKQVGACAQCFPSKITPSSAVSKTIANRIQKPASNLRNGVLDKGSSSNSTSSLFSETAVTGAHNRFSRTTRNNKAEKTKSSVILVSLSRTESKECNNSPRANKETGDVMNGIAHKLTSGDVATTSTTFSTELAAAPDVSKSRVGQKPSLSKPKSSVGPQTKSADFTLPPAVPKLKLGSSSKDGCTTGILSPPRTKQMSAHGTRKMPISTREKTSSARTSINAGSVSVRSSTGSRLPVKTSGLERSSSVSSLLSSHSETSTGTCRSKSTTSTSCKTVDASSRPILSSGAPNSARTSSAKAVMRNRTGVNPTSATGNKTHSSQNQVSSRSTTSQNQITPRTAPGISARPVGSSARNQLAVDQNKPKTSPRSRPPQPQTQSDLLPTENKTLGLAHYKTQCEKKNECIQHLKKLLATSNHRFEAISLVVQHILAEREEALQQHKESSQELVNLHRELVNTNTSCEKLQREKDELQNAFEAVLQKVQEQHQSELADLEEQLKNFYSVEWEKVHEAYQEQAERLKTQLQQQVNDLDSQHKAFRKELETSHSEKIEVLKQQYETSLEELKKSQELEIKTRNESFKEMEASLSEKIGELNSLNNSLNGQLKAEEDRRKALREKNQKDSHTLYLEQELESLKVVLDMKNEQLHQQDKKLMQMENIVEKNIKLDECLKKVQQENEDFRARMDRHAALSRQLSTEQTVLQESLEKESKVNKRLSMENEELLWKLHNGDLSSPRKLSPSSPSMSLQSPRSSGVFSNPAVTPR